MEDFSILKIVETTLRRCSKRGYAIFDMDGTIFLNKKRVCNPLVKRMIELCQYYGLATYLITARPDTPDTVQFTKEQLRMCRTPMQHIIHMPSSYFKDDNWSRYKANARRHLAHLPDNYGKNLCLLVGDNWGDLKLIGPYATERSWQRHHRLPDDQSLLFHQGGILHVKLPK